jgi:hypothetical protein
MNSPLAIGSTWARLFMWLCLAVLAISLCTLRASTIPMDDDNLYLAYGAQRDVALATPLEQSLIDRIAAVPGCEEPAFRLTFRKRYSTNYAGYAAVQRAVQYGATLFVPPGQESIIVASLGAKALVLLLLSIALGFAAIRGPSREVEGAAVCSFITLVALDFAPGWVPAPVRVDITNLALTLGEQVSSLFVIARQHSYFEVTPRNGALLLFVVTLLLKWQGHLTAAVLALLMLAPIHQTYAGIGLVLFAIASAVSRPDVFATSLRRAVLVLAGLVYVVREHFLERLDIWVQIACALALVVAALLFFRGVCSRRFAAFRQRVLGSWAGREIPLDAASLLGFVLLVTLVSWVGDQVMQDPITRRYAWANLPIRTLSFVRFPVFIAGFWLLLARTQWLARPKGRSWFAAACGLSCLALSWVHASRIDTHAYHRLQNELSQNLSKPRGGRPFKPIAEEKRIYANLTMVAAGQMEPRVADENIMAKRKIRCPMTPGSPRERGPALPDQQNPR